MTVIAQRMVHGHDPGAPPLTYREAVAELEALQPGVDGEEVEHLGTKLRRRLKQDPGTGHPGNDDVCHDDTYRRILIDRLIDSGTLRVADLGLLEDGREDDGEDDRDCGDDE